LTNFFQWNAFLDGVSKSRGVQGNWAFKSNYNIDHLIFKLNNMKGRPIQQDVKGVHNVDFLEYCSQRCHSTEMVGKLSQPALIQEEYCGHNIIRYSYKWVQPQYEIAKYLTLIAYFHSSKKWVQREKCVLKIRLPYNDIGYNKIRSEERSSLRKWAHQAAVEMDDNCSIFSSLNPSIYHWTNSVGIDCEVLMHLLNRVQVSRTWLTLSLKPENMNSNMHWNRNMIC
jgi:hypothetical protein